MSSEQIKGILGICAGIYVTLLASGVLPLNLKDPEKTALWHRKFGPLLLILGPVIVIFGILQLIGFFG
jgi:hypothetical protein